MGKQGTPGQERAAIRENRIRLRLEVLAADHIHPAAVSHGAEVRAWFPHLRCAIVGLPLRNFPPRGADVGAFPDVAVEHGLGLERERPSAAHYVEVVTQFDGLEAGARRPHRRVGRHGWTHVGPSVRTDVGRALTGNRRSGCSQDAGSENQRIQDDAQRLHLVSLHDTDSGRPSAGPLSGSATARRYATAANPVNCGGWPAVDQKDSVKCTCHFALRGSGDGADSVETIRRISDNWQICRALSPLRYSR